MNVYLADLKASIVVFLVAMPLCLGVSLASGAPLISGLIAGIVGGIVVGLLSSSKTSVSGPAAGLTVVVLNAVTELGDFYLFTGAVVLAGCAQIMMGVLRAGSVGEYIANSVIKGMLAAIGIILILKQTKYALGTSVSDISSLFDIRWQIFLIFILGLAILSAWDSLIKWSPKVFDLVPAPLAVVLVGILIGSFFNSSLDPSDFVDLPGTGGLTGFLNEIRLPVWEGFQSLLVYKIALTLAIVASLETLLSVEAVDKIDPAKNVTNKNREFIAQGIGNITSGLLGGLPLTAVIVRSSANISAGAKSKISAVLHGVWILIALTAFPNLIELIPLASLAAVLIHVGYKLAKPSLFLALYRLGKSQWIPFVVTIGVVVTTDLLIGIAAGIIVSLVFIKRFGFQGIILVSRTSEQTVVEILNHVSFLNRPQLSQTILSIAENQNILIRIGKGVTIDQDVSDTIKYFVEELTTQKRYCKVVQQ